jgi:hypothetical protein
MIVYGTLKSEDAGNVLFKGNMEECKTFVKGLVPDDYDSLNIDQENGVIEKRYIVNGGFAEDFKELITFYT